MGPLWKEWLGVGMVYIRILYEFATGAVSILVDSRPSTVFPYCISAVCVVFPLVTN